MRKMFHNFFDMFARIFSAGSYAAEALENLAKWAADTTGEFTDAASEERKARLLVLQQQTKAIQENPEQALAEAQAKQAAADLAEANGR